MKPTQFFSPISVTTTRFPLKRQHLIFVVESTSRYTLIAHLENALSMNEDDKVYGYCAARWITTEQFKNGYTRTPTEEVMRIVYE